MQVQKVFTAKWKQIILPYAT